MIPLLLLFPSTVIALGDLWCQSGGHTRDSKPSQCEAGTLECYKYTCAETNYEDADFTARGCGVSVQTTATGLPNESCHQAMSVCEKLGGRGECHVCNNKHLCNSIDRPSTSITIMLSFLFLLHIGVN